MLAIGLMSGTSLNGIDAILCKITEKGKETKIKQLAFETYPLPKDIQNKVELCAANRAIEIAMITSLNFELGELFADTVLDLCESHGLATEELNFVASHGQTLYHQPDGDQEYAPSNLQMEESAVITANAIVL